TSSRKGDSGGRRLNGSSSMAARNHSSNAEEDEQQADRGCPEQETLDDIFGTRLTQLHHEA
ncbi:hypothetical protein, partial [Bradyrhizobium sp.]|uniref:hypothetical protein n=1 Tax=Bradyrhizobium sp. TaxID=376 RepID=UPI002931B63F